MLLAMLFKFLSLYVFLENRVGGTFAPDISPYVAFWDRGPLGTCIMYMY